MMTKEQRHTVQQVFHRFCESDKLETEWSGVDECMSMLEWLDSHQITIEAAVVYHVHGKGQPHCSREHPIGECFVPTIIEAVGIILHLYAQTGNLHPNNRFILGYYLSLAQVGFIVY